MPRPAVTFYRALVQRFRQLIHDEIWSRPLLGQHTVRCRLYAFLRVCTITVQGTFKNKIFVEAAALGYFSLISLGPIIALGVMASTFFLQKKDANFAADTLNRLVVLVAPPVEEYNKVENANSLNQLTPDTPPTPQELDPALAKTINDLVKNSSLGRVGFYGALILVVISVQLIISIEATFNSIWGVRRGRNFLHRVFMYWAIITCAALVGLTAGTLVSAATLADMIGDLPWGLSALKLYGIMPHLLSFLLVATLLACFYRFIPNTAVRWGPAFLGGLTAAFCLVLNNYFSFFYVQQVLRSKSLYGSIGIVPVLMFGLYVFWLLILLGGQLTYAIQNANYLTSDRLWNGVSPRIRRLLGLAAFLQVARAFIRRTPGPTSAELAETLRVPADLLNECLTRLADLHLIAAIPATVKRSTTPARYQPLRPLDHLTLGEFHHDWDELGNSAGEAVLEAADPLMGQYLTTLTSFEQGPQLDQTFSRLLTDEKSAV
jgi:membrane protein